MVATVAHRLPLKVNIPAGSPLHAAALPHPKSHRRPHTHTPSPLTPFRPRGSGGPSDPIPKKPRPHTFVAAAAAPSSPGPAPGSSPGPGSNAGHAGSTTAGGSRRAGAGPILGPALSDLVARFRRLQNGSDIRGIALEGVPNEPVTLSPGAVFFIGVAFARWLRSKGQGAPKVSVGRDPRLSGPILESVFAAGLLQGGAAVVHLFGLATTPAMFYSIVLSGGATSGPASPAFFTTATSVASAAKRAAPLTPVGRDGEDGPLTTPPPPPPATELQNMPYTGAVMITASHLPYNANGLKFFTAAGGLDKPDITELLQLAAVAAAQAGVMLGDPLSEHSHLLSAALATDPSRLARLPFLPAYSAALRDLIKRGVNSPTNYHFPLLGCKLVVNAGNGAGGFFGEQVLAPLGADVSGSVFLDPDGTFPNHPPNPEHPAAMAAGAEAVRAAEAELGIVFDTDVDRSAIVDGAGREINSNRFIALMAAVVLRQHPGTTIVTDSVTSNGLTKFIEQLGGKHMRFKRGYKNVIAAGVKLNSDGEDCQLMMETSGHGALKENYFLDDGAYLAVKAIIEHVRRRNEGAGGISELLAGLQEPLESTEWRIRIQHPDFKEAGAKVLAHFYDLVLSGTYPDWRLEAVNHEGWRVSVDEGEGRKGWALLRQSLHDPLLVLNVESEVEGGAQTTAARVGAFLRSETQKGGPALNLGPLAALLPQ